ncbi:MAG: hypothetical protein CML30_09370 [Rhizobiales bacterium]|nr:hypothetical protein [Hyphomicrobiales bacterium]
MLASGGREMADSGKAAETREGSSASVTGVADPVGETVVPVPLDRASWPNVRRSPPASAPLGFALPHRAFWRRALAEEGERGTLFLLVAVFMGAGAGFYQILGREPGTVTSLAALVLAATAAVWTGYRGGRSFPAMVLCAALAAGFLAGRVETFNGPVLLDVPVTTTVTGEVLEREIDEGGRVRYLLRVIATDDPVLKRPPGRVRLTASASHDIFSPGALVSGRGRLSPPSGPAFPGGYDFARSAYASGIGAYGFFYRAPVVAGDLTEREGGLVDWIRFRITAVRTHISARVREVVAGDPGALIAALTVSDRRGISEATVETLRATGLAHILAISGLHMALAAGTFFLGLRKIAALSPQLVERYPVKKAAALAAILIATSYLAISGAGVATQRAWLMMTVMFVAVIFDRPALTLRNVALAAIVILVLSPSAVISPGFQMSFAATIALIATYEAWSRRRARAERRGGSVSAFVPNYVVAVFRLVAGLAVTSLVAGLATGLFAAWHFHRAAGFGLIANLLAMPLVSFVVMPSGLIAMLAMPFGLDRWPLILMGQGLEWVMDAARFVERLGGDAVTGQIGLASILLAGGGFLILTLLSSRLRLLGLAPIALGLMLTLPPFGPRLPDIVVSEDGRLVGLVGNKSIATNAAKPSDFLFEQWQRAWRRADHLAPITMDGAALPALADQARRTPGRFICSARSRCVAAVGGRLVAALGDPADMGAGCDIADIVILSVPIRARNCRSGAELFTARTLRETGALGFFLEAGNRLTVRTALGDAIRPWTIQRRYDWRSDSFVLPDTAARRAISSESDRARGTIIAGEADTQKPAKDLPFAGSKQIRSGDRLNDNGG